MLDVLGTDGTFTQRCRLSRPHRDRGTRAAVLFDFRTIDLANRALASRRLAMQALLVVGGFIRVLVSGKKLDETDSSPEKPTDPHRQQMPPLPSLLDSMAEETPSS